MTLPNCTTFVLSKAPVYSVNGSRTRSQSQFKWRENATRRKVGITQTYRYSIRMMESTVLVRPGLAPCDLLFFSKIKFAIAGKPFSERIQNLYNLSI